jgi:hypothetical protein
LKLPTPAGPVSIGIRQLETSPDWQCVRQFQRTYLKADETDVKMAFSFVPMPCTTAMVATEIDRIDTIGRLQIVYMNAVNLICDVL